MNEQKHVTIKGKMYLAMLNVLVKHISVSCQINRLIMDRYYIHMIPWSPISILSIGE